MIDDFKDIVSFTVGWIALLAALVYGAGNVVTSAGDGFRGQFNHAVSRLVK